MGLREEADIAFSDAIVNPAIDAWPSCLWEVVAGKHNVINLEWVDGSRMAKKGISTFCFTKRAGFEW